MGENQLQGHRTSEGRDEKQDAIQNSEGKLKNSKLRIGIACVVAIALIAAGALLFGMFRPNAITDTANPSNAYENAKPISKSEKADPETVDKFVQKYKEAEIGGIAAVMSDGTEVTEKEVYDSINQMRVQLNLIENEAWENWLNERGFTVEGLRESQLKMIIQNKKIEQLLAQNNIVISDDEIAEAYNNFKKTFASESDYEEYLRMNALSDSDVREKQRITLAQNKLVLIQEVDENVTDDEIVENCKLAGPIYENPVEMPKIESISDISDENVNAIRERIINGRKYDKLLAVLDKDESVTYNVVNDMSKQFSNGISER